MLTQADREWIRIGFHQQRILAFVILALPLALIPLISLIPLDIGPKSAVPWPPIAAGIFYAVFGLLLLNFPPMERTLTRTLPMSLIRRCALRSLPVFTLAVIPPLVVCAIFWGSGTTHRIAPVGFSVCLGIILMAIAIPFEERCEDLKFPSGPSGLYLGIGYCIHLIGQVPGRYLFPALGVTLAMVLIAVAVSAWWRRRPDTGDLHAETLRRGARLRWHTPVGYQFKWCLWALTFGAVGLVVWLLFGYHSHRADWIKEIENFFEFTLLMLPGAFVFMSTAHLGYCEITETENTPRACARTLPVNRPKTINQLIALSLFFSVIWGSAVLLLNGWVKPMIVGSADEVDWWGPLAWLVGSFSVGLCVLTVMSFTGRQGDEGPSPLAVSILMVVSVGFSCLVLGNIFGVVGVMAALCLCGIGSWVALPHLDWQREV